LAAFAMLAFFIVKQDMSQRARLVHLAMRALAFIPPLAALLLASQLLAPEPLLPQFLDFASTITHGAFSEGWSLPFAFLWHAEHFLFVFWLAAAIYALWRLWKGERTSLIIFGLVGIAFVYANLVLFSVVLEKFVVYGRLARQLVPFLCLLAALLIESIWVAGTRGRRAAMLLLAVLVIQAGLNFYPPLVQMFPADFRQAVRPIRLTLAPDEFRFLNVHFIHPFTLADEPELRPHEVVLASPHPLEYLPFQYQGYTPEKRAYLRSADITMKFIVILE
jgi:hypothetical protein